MAVITAEKNRIIKILESANIKLSSVLSDVFGVSGSRIIEDLANEKVDPKELTKHIAGNVKNKTEDFIRALTGRVTKHHSFLIKQSLKHINEICAIIQDLEQQIDIITSQYSNEFELLQTIPGVSNISAAAIMAETGVDMNQFPSDQHLSS